MGVPCFFLMLVLSNEFVQQDHADSAQSVPSSPMASAFLPWNKMIYLLETNETQNRVLYHSKRDVEKSTTYRQEKAIHIWPYKMFPDLKNIQIFRLTNHLPSLTISNTVWKWFRIPLCTPCNSMNAIEMLCK